MSDTEKTSMLLKNVTGSYVHILNTKPLNEKDKLAGKNPSYGFQAIIPRDHPQIKELMVMQKRAAIKKFGSDVSLKRIKMPLRNGTKERDEPHYQGTVFFNCGNAKRKPGIVDNFNRPMSLEDQENKIYSGALYHISISFYGFEVDAKGVAVAINNVMWRKHGDRLDGTTEAKDDFSDLADTGGVDDAFDDLDDLDGLGEPVAAGDGLDDDFDDDIPF